MDQLLVGQCGLEVSNRKDEPKNCPVIGTQVSETMETFGGVLSVDSSSPHYAF